MYMKALSSLFIKFTEGIEIFHNAILLDACLRRILTKNLLLAQNYQLWLNEDFFFAITHMH